MDSVVHFTKGGYYSVCEMPVEQDHGDVICPRCGLPGEVLPADLLKARLTDLGYVIHDDGDSFTVTGQAFPPSAEPDSVPQSIMQAVKLVAKSVKRRTKGRK